MGVFLPYGPPFFTVPDHLRFWVDHHPVLQHWARAESPFLSARTWAMSRRFSRLLVAVGRGDSAVAAMKAQLFPALSKAMVHEFMTTQSAVSNPNHALRFAQVIVS